MSKHTKFVTKSQKRCQAKANFLAITEKIFAIYIKCLLLTYGHNNNRLIVTVIEIKNLQSYEHIDQFAFLTKSLDKVRQRQLLKNRDELCVNAFKLR